MKTKTKKQRAKKNKKMEKKKKKLKEKLESPQIRCAPTTYHELDLVTVVAAPADAP